MHPGSLPVRPAPAPAPAAALAVRPLWTISGATAWLRRHPDDILRMIEDGRLEWAWDIAAGPCRRRREIRIWFESLEWARRNLSRPAQDLLLPPTYTPAQVFERIVGHHRPWLRGSEVQALLNCDRNLVFRHLRAGALRLASSQASLTSRTPLILRTSLEQFLLARRIQ
ncbi:MAG: hypothetical protein N3J91_06805 [Verrucomicrobiae bacterium]|nr:hypothetical protein [Verrucomicrobiae bacterium]